MSITRIIALSLALMFVTTVGITAFAASAHAAGAIDTKASNPFAFTIGDVQVNDDDSDVGSKSKKSGKKEDVNKAPKDTAEAARAKTETTRSQRPSMAGNGNSQSGKIGQIQPSGGSGYKK